MIKNTSILITIFFYFLSCKPNILETPTVQGSSEAQDFENFNCKYDHISLNKRSPQTINDVTDLINELPKPLDLPCFVSSLARPLKINLTLSSTSAQPAVGRTSPRVFIFNDKLVLSIAPEGKGEKLLEVSYMYTPDNSLKGEYQFPIYQQISSKYPFDRIATVDGINESGTTCQGCHNGESLDPNVTETKGFTSVAIKPSSNMLLSTFRLELTKCELNNINDYRCKMIRAIFLYEDPDEIDFPSDTPRWIDTI